MAQTENGNAACDHCGRVYNPFIGDRFWSGQSYPCTQPAECESGGGEHRTLCDNCHRDLVREADRR